MSFIDKITSILPFGKSEEQLEYFFALDIGQEVLKVCLWAISGDKLKILKVASDKYSSSDEIVEVTDKLLDQALGALQIEPEKILFGVPDSWLVDDNLKDPYLQLLRTIVKNLDLKPLAYVSSSHAICHFLEREEGAPPTAILAGVGESQVIVTVVRGGKIDGTRALKRGENLGQDIEKLLMSFTEVEVLPSRMLLFEITEGNLEKRRNDLLSYPWMERLSFLHLPKIEVLEKDIEIKSVALAGASELNPDIKYQPEEAVTPRHSPLTPLPVDTSDVKSEDTAGSHIGSEVEASDKDLGFITGDITKESRVKSQESSEAIEAEDTAGSQSGSETGGEELEKETEEEMAESTLAVQDFGHGSGREVASPPETKVTPSEGFQTKAGFGFPGLSKLKFAIPGIILIAGVALFLFLSQAKVTVFVEPKILEKDTQITADPKAKTVDETNKIIPGQIVETQVSGSDKLAATGKKQVGDAAKGTVVITNKTNSPKSFSKETVLVGPDNLKFTLQSSLTVASSSATEDGISFGKSSVDVTALDIGADGNITSGSQLTIQGQSTSDFSAKSEGNFSGGSSKDVTVVSDSDQKKLLAELVSNLRKQAQDKLQSKLKGKKVLEEALTEEIVKKSFSKNINDQASEFSLNLTVNYKGTSYSDDDLKSIVSKLVETNVPDGFKLDLADTETQADVSKVDKDGKLIFLARFKAKLTPKIDEADIRKKIKGKTPEQAANILKSYDNVLGSEINITPSLPKQFARLPFLDRNIKIEVSLK